MHAILRNALLCLERCKSLKTLKQIHAQVLISGLQNENYVAVKLVSFCSKTLGNVDHARRIFDSCKSSANVFLWTTMVVSYSNHQTKIVKEAISIYRMMHERGVHPNNFTLSSVLKACSLLKAISEGEQIHAHSTKLGFSSSPYVVTTLLDMYSKFGYKQETKHLFRTTPEKNVAVCNTMIAYYAKVGDLETAKSVFDEMVHRDSISWSIMISSYADNGNMSAAREIFDQNPEKNIKSWNCLMVGYSRNGRWSDCIQLFNEMASSHMRANHVTMTTMMSACSQLGALKVGRQFHGILYKSCIEIDTFVYNSLVDMYGKCGAIREAYQVFTELPIKDVVSYNVMICGFVNHGYGEDALKLVPEMQEKDIQPDRVTFIGILNACSQTGHLELCQYYFNCMRSNYGVERSVDHYACMVDLFGRAGFIEEAYNLVKTMSVEPHAGVWGALLHACVTYCHVEIGEIAANELFRIEPENPGNYVLLSNIYARAQLWDRVKEVRRFMRERGVAKVAGFSSIEVDDKVHEFLMRDASHPQWQEIYGVLDYLSFELE
ncbi:uncharacterized protein A4U43_C05F10710 [Asparagus officinalis]|uniref:Pentacotripeptide-repeat region of PRORP domain-containing protein n=1 Tax=Asparagus officinalis TaxID=4686 RepID=A0A5P1EUG7_ASPOF|nr:pentatricopeptide repeat-containing protein At3g29230-like [Asparagus officinalis]ONK68369.1 uncharacterized protein A4U43_C05F10710 [Asparagus officinalis]